MRTIAVMNQKGGVGKTTTTFNLGHALALEGLRVLLLDLDPQAHLSAAFGPAFRGLDGLDSVLLDGASIEAVSHAVRDGVTLVPAGERLTDVEHLTAGGVQRGWLLSRALEGLQGHDVLLIDCPPSSGLLVTNALFAAEELLIPVSGDYLSLNGLARMMAIINFAEERLKRRVRKWLALTRYQGRRRLAREVRDRLLGHFPGQLLQTPIREAVALAESPGFGKTIFEYQRAGNGAHDYRSMATDLLQGRTL
jgi:chromosome partitioning protein